MFRSKTTMQQHSKKRTMEQATSHFSTQFQSYHPSLTNVQDNSCHPSIHTPVRPHFLSTIRQNSSSSSSSAHSRSIQSSSSTHSRSIQSEPTQYEPILHASSSSSSLLDRDQDLFDESEMNLLSEVEIIDEHGNVIRQQKMTSKDVFKLKRGEKVLVHVNGFHQPIKSSGGLCTRFMTLLLKEPNLCPPDVKNWEECKSSCGITLLIEFRRRFSLPQGESVDKVILKKFNEKFRTLKFRLKDKLFKLAAKRLNEVNNIVEDGEQEMRYTDDELLEALDFLEPPNNFTVKQWETYKKNLRKPEAKILSQYGKKARAEKLHCHTLGAVSLARKRDEFKMKNGRDANAVEFFEDCYRTKAGSYVDKATNELMDHARQVISRKFQKLVVLD